jgi:hypothetical protein
MRIAREIENGSPSELTWLVLRYVDQRAYIDRHIDFVLQRIARLIVLARDETVEFGVLIFFD